METLELKKCRVCGLSKLLDDFSKYGKYTRGECKSCRSKIVKEWHYDNKEVSLAKKKVYEQTSRGRYNRYKCNSKTNNILFELTLEQFIEITSKPCFYCNNFTEGKKFCGIDKVDSSLGYVINNCVPCCEWCNRMKWIYSKTAFENKILHLAQVFYERK